MVCAMSGSSAHGFHVVALSIAPWANSYFPRCGGFRGHAVCPGEAACALRCASVRVDQGREIVPDVVMTAPAARLTRPSPLPLAPANLPVPPTMVCVISNHCGAFDPAADEFPGEIRPTMLSCMTSVLPSANVIVRTSQLVPHASKATHWNAT